MLCNKCGKEINDSKCSCTDIDINQHDQSTKTKINDTNQTRMIFDIFSISCLILAICFTILSFVLSSTSQIVVISFAILFYISFFVCNGIKIKKLNKKERK